GEPAVTRYRRLPSRLPVTDASDPERQPVSYASDPEAAPVSYARDPERHLSPTPATPIGAVDGVGDRTGNLSMAEATGRVTWRWRWRQEGGAVDGGGERP